MKRGSIKGDGKGGVDDDSIKAHKEKLDSKKKPELKNNPLTPEPITDFDALIDGTSKRVVPIITQEEMDELLGNYSKNELWFNAEVGVVQIVEFVKAENPKGGKEHINLIWYEPRGADADFIPMATVKEVFEIAYKPYEPVYEHIYYCADKKERWETSYMTDDEFISYQGEQTNDFCYQRLDFTKQERLWTHKTIGDIEK